MSIPPQQRLLRDDKEDAVEPFWERDGKMFKLSRWSELQELLVTALSKFNHLLYQKL